MFTQLVKFWYFAGIILTDGLFSKFLWLSLINNSKTVHHFCFETSWHLIHWPSLNLSFVSFLTPTILPNQDNKNSLEVSKICWLASFQKFFAGTYFCRRVKIKYFAGLSLAGQIHELQSQQTLNPLKYIFFKYYKHNNWFSKDLKNIFHWQV